MSDEQALAYFRFGALEQFYVDGNQRTARYLMNGHLMSHGIDVISVPARRAREFNTRMVDFYRLRSATHMFAFLTDCHPDAEQLMTARLRRVLTGRAGTGAGGRRSRGRRRRALRDRRARC